jgi:hypothetical protein
LPQLAVEGLIVVVENAAGRRDGAVGVQELARLPLQKFLIV